MNNGDLYKKERKRVFKKILVIMFAIFSISIALNIVNYSPDNSEEKVTFYIVNNYNDNLFRISIKRCFLSQFDKQSRSIQQGDKLRMVWFNFPTYTFSGGYPSDYKKILDECPDKNAGLTLAYIQSSSRILESRVNFYSREKRDNMVYFIGRDKINTLFVPTKRTELQNLKILVHVNLDSKERQKYHGPFLNSYEIYSPLNDDIGLSYTIYTRFYRYLPEIQDSHKKFNKDQCVPEVAYCVPNNPADVIYDAVQKQEDLLDCKECLGSLLVNDAQVANFFLQLNQ